MEREGEWVHGEGGWESGCMVREGGRVGVWRGSERVGVW